jgi:hypothetical protein
MSGVFRERNRNSGMGVRAAVHLVILSEREGSLFVGALQHGRLLAALK